MLFSGLFFVGCGENPVDKLTLTADKSSVEVFAGESENITFTIGNYTNGIDTSLSFSLVDSTVSSTKSEHVELEVVNHDGTQTTVKITGVSGGNTTLVANTNEGNKIAVVAINVKQYSSKFEIKDNSLLYVSKATQFIPSEKLFKFDDSATERKVSFHVADTVSKANDNNAFVKAELVQEESGAYSVLFYQEDGFALDFDEYRNVLEGTGINIIAKYYNRQTDKTESQQFTLTVLYGFDEDVKIEAYDDNGAVELIELVTNDPVTEANNWRSKKFKVKVPHVENVEGGENVIFDFENEKNSLILVEKVKNIAESNGNFDIYDFEVVSTAVASSEATIALRLYYKIDGISYVGSGDASVEQQVQIPVRVRIAPTKIVVNSTEQTAPENQYSFYNHYDGDFGWEEFKIDVYAPESSFDHVLMTFDNDLIVKYKSKTYVAGVASYQLKIDDVSQPVYIRGASDANETTAPKQIKFEVISNYARETFTYNCNYSILTGATKLEYDNPNTGYEYKPSQPTTGVFVSTTMGDVVFDHLVADNDFASAIVSYYEGNAAAARVRFDSKDDYEASEYGKLVNLKITPYQVGDVTYKVTLDNGVSKLITFRIIDTFDNLSVNLAGAGNDGVQSAEKVEKAELEEGFDDEMNLIIQNTTYKDDEDNTKISFGKTARLVLGSPNGTDVFSSTTYSISNPQVISANAQDKTMYVLTTLPTAGEGYIDFRATGTSVDDFKITSITRHAKVNFTSFVPIYSLSVKDKNGMNANNVSLYVGNMVSDAALQTAQLSISVDPESEAYGFFDPATDTMKNEKYSPMYVYWTIGSGANPFNLDNSSAKDGRMIYGNTYKIGPDPYNYFGTFDTITNTFTVNKDMKSTFSFTMFAAIRQYGNSKYFSVSIKGETYDFVERIYTNLGENSVKLSPLKTSHDVGVFLNPSNATDTEVVVRYINKNANNEDKLLINSDDIVVVKVGGGISLVKITLNPEILSNVIKGNLSGELQIIPHAWYVNGSIISGYENSIVKIIISYEDGTAANPYSLSSAEDVVAIGNSAAAMKAHYKLTTTIDMSAYSSKLPLGSALSGSDGVFSGSIIGEGDASIIGLNIRRGDNGAYGLFKSVSGTIKNITLKGKFNITDATTNHLTVGLLSSNTVGATLHNISAYITGGTISANEEVTFGGLVGVSSATITDMCVIFEDYVNILSSTGAVSAGGIAGTSSSEIKGRENISGRFGLSAYSVYALIRVGAASDTVPEYGQAAAVVATQTGSSVTNILAGGVIFAKYAGGIAGTFTENEATTINNLTIRTQIRGQEVGLIAVNAGDGSLNNEFSNFKVQATDDGVSTGIYASMYVKLANKITTVPDVDVNRLLLSNSMFAATGSTTFASYVNRDLIDIEYNEISKEFTNDDFFGDVIFVSVNDKLVVKTYSFEKQSTTFDVQANEEKGFKALASTAEGANANVIFAYYFQAAGYYGVNGLTTESDQIQHAQKVLDALNHVENGDEFYPLKIIGSDISISSNSPLVEISASGELYIKGAGLAELEISSLLNKKQNETIYLYIINYFNVDSYQTKSDAEGNVVPAEETGIFTMGDLVLGQESEFKVYADAGVDVLISPSYSYSNFTLDVEGKTLDVNVSRSGLLKIGNDLIQLSKNRTVSASVKGTLNYGTATPSRDGMTFTKNGNVGKDQTDTITLKAAMKQEIGGKTYSLDITTLENVKISYYEGAKAIKSLAENYVLSSSVTVVDTYLIDSDDTDDTLDVNEYQFVDSETGEIVGWVDQQKDDSGNVIATTKNGLFKLDLTKTADLKYKAQISVNKNSEEFKNRFTNNIYKDYILKLKATSNSRYLKEIPVTLVQENVDVIAFTNYKIFSTTSEGETTFGLEEYNNIVPGTRGILSVALSPIDADFDYLKITNNEMNNLDGASQGTFILGRWSEEEGFVAIQGTEYVDGGVKISKANLEKALNDNGDYQGQIYVRYIFSNRDVEDGVPVGINITVEQAGGEISRVAKYNFYKKDDVAVSLVGYTDKKYVARGMEYELDVRAIGYDPETISLTTNKPQQAAIVERDGKYYLKITDDTIIYGDRGLGFKLTLSASKTDDMGEVATETVELDLTILEYVINYNNVVGGDIVSGVENGILNIAVGDKRQLEIAFDGLIEYNSANPNVEVMVKSFLNDLSTHGSWTIYTDLNVNNSNGEPIKNLPIDESNSTISIISAGEEFNIKYLKISNLALTTIQSHDPHVAKRYYFKYDASYRIAGGKYVYENAGPFQINTKFDVYSYMRGSEESPNPVTSYQEFLEMEQGGYYIQLADIHVPAGEFAPLNTAIKYYDGNSYKFIFDDAKYNLNSTSAAGLFGSVGASTVIKNVTVQIGSDEVDYVEFNSAATSAINFGFVAGINAGTITNAKVLNGGGSTSLTFKNTPAAEGYYFGGIVGQNTGYITHSQSYVNVESCISMGGVVGTNQGTLASSFFKGGVLTNTSIYNDIFGVGGVVAVNSENAVIITSYSSGDVSGECAYADYKAGSSAINSSVPLGGFIYFNEGTIRDCYSNIPLVTTSRSAGFAFGNDGKIIRSFSTSKITNDNSATNYYFAGEGIGVFENCYYITGNNINKTLSPLAHNGVNPLKYNEGENEFEDLATYFADYSYSGVPSYNSVWFFSDGKVSSAFPSQQFAGGRLELTSANIIATSKKEHVKTTVNADGITTYVYATASGNPDDGSVFNPYVIYSPETMENYIVTNNKIATGNYRLVCPLDYSVLPSNYSNLYKVDLRGNFEGNNMSITGITLASNEQLSYAGLFGSITGSGSGENASIMNFNLTPKEVIFSNTAEVGSLAGRVQNANLYNINIYGASAGDEVDTNDELATVTGKNIVGGVVGLAKTGYKIKNVRSLIGAFATNVPYDKSEIDYEKESADYNNLSFAGAVAGYLAGTGSVTNIRVDSAAINIVGGKAGFMFGGIANGATVEYAYLTLNASMHMKPYRYAGFIAGEIKGKTSNVYVYGYTTLAAGTEELFALKPYTAVAIGGIAGLLNGGQINMAYVSQGLAIGNQPTAAVEINTVDYVGGIVGQVKGSGNKIGQVLATGDLSAKNIIGGIVGQVSNGASLAMSEAAYRANDLLLEGQNAKPTVGGLIGNVDSEAIINIKNSYGHANITIKAYAYSTAFTAGFGGIIGKSAGTITLENIYTTSIYNITLEDKSSTSATGMVYDGYTEDPPGTRNYGGYYLDGNGKTGGEIEDEKDATNGEANKAKNDLRKINYSLKQATASCTNVYNSSIDSMPNSLGGKLEKGYTTLLARKFGSTEINVVQNEYGTDLYSIISGKLTEDINLLTDVEYTIKQAFKGLFEDNNLWKASKDSANANPYLAFEENLKLIP